MAALNKDYQNVLTILRGRFTVNSIYNKLTKVSVSTEDRTLRNEVEDVLKILGRAAKGSVNLSSVVPIDLSDGRYGRIVGYCDKCLASSKPQWQILAERNGWIPPEKN